MCFSANVSFVTGSLLLLTGIAAVSKTKSKSQVPFASIPIFFSIQQFTEGLLWLNKFNNIILSYIFLFFAFVFWTTWMPFSVMLLEKEQSRKKLISIILFIGILVSIYIGYYLIKNGVNYEQSAGHIKYIFNIPYFNEFLYLIYLGCLLLPFFISSNRLINIFGLAAITSLLISFYVYFNFIISLWCFFAAALSVFVYFVVKKLNQEKHG